MAYDNRITELRKRIFDAIALAVSTERIWESQEILGLWFEGGVKNVRATCIPYGELGTIQLLVTLSEQDGHEFSVYLYVVFGEIRCGVKFKKNLVSAAMLENIKTIIPGVDAVELDLAGDSYFCDFVFRDKWIAKTDVMFKLLTDKATEELFVDALTKTCQHVIVATLRNILRTSVNQ